MNQLERLNAHWNHRLEDYSTRLRANDVVLSTTLVPDAQGSYVIIILMPQVLVVVQATPPTSALVSATNTS